MVKMLRNQDFERLFEEHAQPLFGFLVYRTGDRALAEDVLADTFERALRARRRFDPRRGNEKNWLYTIALNLLRDRHRRAEAEARALEQLGDPVQRSDGADELVADRDLIRRALEGLSTEEREAVALRYGADLTLPEIAKLTRVRRTTVEGRVYRALRKLRAELTGPVEQAPGTNTRPRSTASRIAAFQAGADRMDQ
jgi:RNA polymerase sigma factor (sigma-70 family)